MDFFSIEYLKGLTHTYVIPFGIDLVLAILVFYVGRAIARLVTKLLSKLLKRSNVDDSLTKFLCDLAYGLLVLVVGIAALDQMGVETTAAVAVLGAMGLAVGFALQGSLGNFASGVMLMIFKPYTVGDLVKLCGELGHVDSIKVFNTTLITLDNRTIIIPNGNITGSTIENLSAQGRIRIDMVFGIGYDDDIKQAKEIMMNILTSDERVMKDPGPTVAVLELGDSSVNFAVRPFVDPAVYWDVYFDTHEKVKLALDEAGISIPYPQQDVHMHQVDVPKAA